MGEESWRRPCSRMELACTCELFDGCCPVTDPVSPVLPLRKYRNTAWLWPLPLNFSPLLSFATKKTASQRGCIGLTTPIPG